MTRVHSGQIFTATFLILLGALLLAGNFGLLAFGWGQAGPLFLIALGVWLVWRGFQPRGEQWRSEFSWGFGDYAPDLAGKMIRAENFSHGFGEMELDLSRAIIPDGESRVRASHGFGELKIRMPREVAVRVNARAGFGEVSLFEDEASGIGLALDFQSENYAAATRKLTLEAHIGLGK